jgi:hypothetical protein
MNIKACQGVAETISPQCSRLFSVVCLLLCILFLLSPSGLVAQVQEQPPEQTSESVPETAEDTEESSVEGLVEEPVEVVVSLPDSHQMALAVATPGLREQALLDLAVAETDQAALAKSYLLDRAWLQSLVDRYGWVQPRSSVLDPAAWLVLEELQQHDIKGTALIFPGRSSKSMLLYQVFQRAGERLAVANLPILLLEVEADAITLWDAFLKLTESRGKRDAAWKVVENAWFTDRQMPAPLILDVNSQKATPDDSPDDEPGHEFVAENISLAMSAVMLSTVDAGPPDRTGLVQLRYSILNDIAQLSATENTRARDQVRDTLYLLSLIDGLHDGHYFEFIRGLLAISSSLLELHADVEETYSLVNWLAAELPAISAHYAVDFARVDPRLNTVMASAYGVLLNIANSNDIDIKASRAVLADAVAQLALLIPDMGYYFDTPVRGRIVEEINICISIAVSVNDDGIPTMTRRQFDACMETLLELADQETRLAELSGDMNGPFTTETLRRELSITPWQRINYGIGYLHDRYSTDCQPPDNALPNPLEWAVLANTMAWFAEDGPVYFQTPENEARLTRMRNIGEQLILGLAEQSACLAAAGTGINDPVYRGMVDYELALRELVLGIENAEADFRAQRLSPGADVSLERDALQATAYRPDSLVIEPCDTRAVCEMSGNLSTTRALIGLFPDQYLLAEQTGMGRIEICYRNMEWVQRRSELVRPDDENVANYFGHLGFDLVGRYIEKGQVSDIFGFRFTSPEEHHYLFAQTSDDVLNDSCPVEWVGSRVITPLREKRGGIVPNRLTYLAASRKAPSRLLQNNWDRGAEWRDWFVTGIGVSALEIPPSPEITTRLNQHLQSLYRAEQAEIYQRVLLPNARNSEGDDVSLFDEMSQVSIAKSLIRMQMILFYPESLSNSDSIRMAVAGDAGLLEGRTLRRFRVDNVPLTSVNGIAHERLDRLREAWLEQPEAVRRQGSVPASLMHALTRINVLYRQFFTSRPEPLQEIEVTARPTDS